MCICTYLQNTTEFDQKFLDMFASNKVWALCIYHHFFLKYTMQKYMKHHIGFPTDPKKSMWLCTCHK